MWLCYSFAEDFDHGIQSEGDETLEDFCERVEETNITEQTVQNSVHSVPENSSAANPTTSHSSSDNVRHNLRKTTSEVQETESLRLTRSRAQSDQQITGTNVLGDQHQSATAEQQVLKRKNEKERRLSPSKLRKVHKTSDNGSNLSVSFFCKKSWLTFWLQLITVYAYGCSMWKLDTTKKCCAWGLGRDVDIRRS